MIRRLWQRVRFNAFTRRIADARIARRRASDAAFFALAHDYRDRADRASTARFEQLLRR